MLSRPKAIAPVVSVTPHGQRFRIPDSTRALITNPTGLVVVGIGVNRGAISG